MRTWVPQYDPQMLHGLHLSPGAQTLYPQSLVELMLIRALSLTLLHFHPAITPAASPSNILLHSPSLSHLTPQRAFMPPLGLPSQAFCSQQAPPPLHPNNHVNPNPLQVLS